MSKREYMHEWLKADAVEYDLPSEEIIQKLAEDNTELQAENDKLKEAIKEVKSAAERVCKVYFEMLSDEFDEAWIRQQRDKRLEQALERKL